MSETASTSVVAMGMGMGMGEMGYAGYKPPFTAVQWQELEHQAMIYKYLVAGVPVPPDLVMPIRRSFDAISARLFHHPSLGYCSYYGKKFDPEPGRCRRTDGKKWRCSKDAHPDSKYCERHMHRGRNRSRKPVESTQSTSRSSLSSSTAMSQISSGTGAGSNLGNFQGGGGGGAGSGSYQNMPLYMNVGSEGSSYGNNLTKLQVEPISYGVDTKDFRYIHAQETNDPRFSPDASGSVGSLGLATSVGTGTWRLMPSQVNSTFKNKPDSQLFGPSSNVPHGFEPISPSMSSKQLHQHCFLGNEIGSGSGSSDPVKRHQQHHPVHPFFSEWPSEKESWTTLDNDNLFSTQLSISIPRTSSSFSSGSAAFSPNDA